MTYTKPEIAGLPSVLETVQSDQQVKLLQITFDVRALLGNSPAYEADE